MQLRLSFSTINMFHECPRAYHYKLQNVPEETVESEASIFGRTVHTIIMLFYERLKKNPEANIEELFDSVREECSNFVITDNWEKIQKVRYNFLRFEKDRRRYIKDITDVEVEKRLTANFQRSHENECYDINLIGIVDFIDKSSRTAYDWKTGSSKVYGDANVLQASIYRLLLKEHGVDVDKIRFFNLNIGQCMDIPNVENSFLFNKVDNIFRAVKTKNFPKKPSYLCKYCPYRTYCDFDGESLWQIGL